METTLRTQPPRSKGTPAADDPPSPRSRRTSSARWTPTGGPRNACRSARSTFMTTRSYATAQLDHVKPRLLGHWGTTPGQNFVYVHLNRIIKEYDLNIIYVSDPAMAACDGRQRLPGGDVQRDLPEHLRGCVGMQKLFKQFSFPGGIPSHVAPETPGSIHEGGELGYSLSHASARRSTIRI